MTSLRWDNVPKRRVERPALLAPSSKAGRRKQSSFRERIEEAGKKRAERQDLSRSATVSAFASGTIRSSGLCSACRAQGVTLWRVKGLLVCATCRSANRVADVPQSGHRRERDLPKAARTKNTVTVTIAGRDITWAVGQGADDRNAGTVCPKYKDFLSTYKLSKSPFTLQMWNAYRIAEQSTPRNTASAASRRGPLNSPDSAQSQPPAAAALKDPEWAARQGHKDAVAGKARRKYKAFLIAYGLRESDSSIQLWKTYRKHAERAQPKLSTPRPMQKKCRTRGLTLRDPSTPRRKTVRRYDRVEPRWSDLSPENAALLMKVNQQNTLVDMWR